LALLIPFFALSLFWAWITVFAAKNSHIITNPYFNTSASSLNERVHLSSLSVFYYLRQLIAPLNFTIVYPEGYYSHPFNAFYTVFLAIGIVALFIFHKRRPDRTRPLLFGTLFFLITLLPFLKIYSTTSSLTNDRYCYLACYGIFFVLALWTNNLIEKRAPLVKTISGIAAVYLVMITWGACQNWKNSTALWSNQIAAYPKAYPAYVGRADSLLSQGRYQNALEDLDRALQLKPDYIEALNLKGTTLLLSGSPQAAIESYTKVLMIEPANISALNNRAASYLSLGMYENARDDLDKSINLDARQIDPYYNRSIALIGQGQYQPALDDIKFVLNADPGHELARSQYQNLKKVMGLHEP
jgi:tetratricopeptide (TPR) repeat protein